jgi:hypothetical protein
VEHLLSFVSAIGEILAAKLKYKSYVSVEVAVQFSVIDTSVTPVAGSAMSKRVMVGCAKILGWSTNQRQLWVVVH